MWLFYAIPITFSSISIFYLIYYIKKNNKNGIQLDERFGNPIRIFKDATEFSDRRNDLHFP